MSRVENSRSSPAAQQGLDDAPHAILLQLVRQLVEMRLAALDDPLLRTPDVVPW